MKIQGNRLYILDEMVVHVYSMTDFSYIRKFGGRGNGPGEFNTDYYPMTPVQIRFKDKEIILFRMFKMALFSKSGQVIEEKRIHFLTADILPFHNNYLISKVRLANQYVPGKETIHRRFLNLYSKDLKELKNLHTIEYTTPDVDKVGYQIFRPAQIHTCHDGEKIYLYAERSMPKILVFDEKGNSLMPIVLDIPRKSISNSFKKKVEEWMLKVPTLKGFKEINILYPEFLPAIRNLAVKNNKLLGQTYEKQGMLTKFIIYDLALKTYTTVFLPTAEREQVSFTNNKIFSFTGTLYYYLVDNYEEETWELWSMEFNL
jgi:hypothetical protein